MTLSFYARVLVREKRSSSAEGARENSSDKIEYLAPRALEFMRLRRFSSHAPNLLRALLLSHEKRFSCAFGASKAHFSRAYLLMC